MSYVSDKFNDLVYWWAVKECGPRGMFLRASIAVGLRVSLFSTLDHKKSTAQKNMEVSNKLEENCDYCSALRKDSICLDLIKH